MSTSGSGRGKDHGKHPSKSSSSKKNKGVHKSTADLIESLTSTRLKTLSDLRRIERVAMTTTPDAAAALHGPLTSAWTNYVTSNQLLLELRGLTRNYPLCAEIIHEAHTRALAGPLAGRSWNLAWLVLQEMRGDGLITCFAVVEAQKPEMWGGRRPSSDEMAQLAACFEAEWGNAVDTMLRHWTVPPMWY